MSKKIEINPNSNDANTIREGNELPKKAEAEANENLQESYLDTDESESDDISDSDLLQPLGPFSPPLKELRYYIPRHPKLSYELELVEENEITPDTPYDEYETYYEYYSRLVKEAAVSLDMPRAMSLSKVLKTLRRNSYE
nr:hypothetical protein K-LCC10_0032 [Kaumoebavirus]